MEDLNLRDKKRKIQINSKDTYTKYFILTKQRRKGMRCQVFFSESEDLLKEVGLPLIFIGMYPFYIQTKRGTDKARIL